MAEKLNCVLQITAVADFMEREKKKKRLTWVFDLILWLKQNSAIGERPDPPPCGSLETLITGSGQVC